jgi:superfamily II helicase
MEAATVDIKSAQRRIREVPRKEASVTVLSSAELVECTCQDFCDRDHDRD